MPALFMPRTIHHPALDSSDFVIILFLRASAVEKNRIHPSLFTSPFSSITGNGHSGQLCDQHTMMSALLAS